MIAEVRRPTAYRNALHGKKHKTSSELAPKLIAPSLSLSVPPYTHPKDDHLVELVGEEEDGVFHNDLAVISMSDACGRRAFQSLKHIFVLHISVLHISVHFAHFCANTDTLLEWRM